MGNNLVCGYSRAKGADGEGGKIPKPQPIPDDSVTEKSNGENHPNGNAGDDGDKEEIEKFQRSEVDFNQFKVVDSSEDEEEEEEEEKIEAEPEPEPEPEKPVTEMTDKELTDRIEKELMAVQTKHVYDGVLSDIEEEVSGQYSSLTLPSVDSEAVNGGPESPLNGDKKPDVKEEGEEAVEEEEVAGLTVEGYLSKKEEVEEALFLSEHKYSLLLQNMVRQYIKPLKSEEQIQFLGVSPVNIDTLFSNLSLLADLHDILYDDLVDEDTYDMFDVFIQNAKHFRLYAGYSRRYLSSLQALNECGKSSKFSQFIRLKSMMSGSDDLVKLLQAPFRRIQQINKAFQELVAVCPRNSPFYGELSVAAMTVRQIASDVEEAQTEANVEAETMGILDTLPTLARIKFKPKFERKGRLFLGVGEGGSGEKEREEEFSFALFPSLLVWSTIVEATGGLPKIVDKVYLDSAVYIVRRGEDEVSFSLSQESGNGVSLSLRASSEEERENWVTTLEICLAKVVVEEPVEVKLLNGVDHDSEEEEEEEEK